MKDYTLEELMIEFKKCSEITQRNKSSLIEQFKEESPDKELPSWLNEEFYLSDGLNSICQEIIELKKTSRAQPCAPDHPASSLDGD